MADVVTYINPVLSAIEHRVITLEPRGYLGMSSLGKECRRAQWLTWRWAYIQQVEPRLLRLWNRGHREEPVIVKDLEEAGMIVSNDQAECVHTILGRHCMGHIDGEIEKVPGAPKTRHLGEYKTMADKYWVICDRDGVQESNPVYYYQMQIYMKYRKLKRALFIAVNKNNDKRLYERVKFEEADAEEMQSKAIDIVASELPPKGISTDPAFYKCKMCNARDVCFGVVEPTKNCRTCVRSSVEDNGVWKCTQYDAEIPEEAQRVGCPDHSVFF